MASLTSVGSSAGSVVSVQFGTSGDAGVLGQQLVQARQAAGQGGEIDGERAESLADAINELFDGLGCSTPRGAET